MYFVYFQYLDCVLLGSSGDEEPPTVERTMSNIRLLQQLSQDKEGEDNSTDGCDSYSR